MNCLWCFIICDSTNKRTCHSHRQHASLLLRFWLYHPINVNVLRLLSTACEQPSQNTIFFPHSGIKLWRQQQHNPNLCCHSEEILSSPILKWMSENLELFYSARRVLMMFGSNELVSGKTLFITRIIVGKVSLISSPMLYFMCMYVHSCSAGSHRPWSAWLQKTLRTQDTIKLICCACCVHRCCYNSSCSWGCFRNISARLRHNGTWDNELWRLTTMKYNSWRDQVIADGDQLKNSVTQATLISQTCIQPYEKVHANE